MQAQPLLPPPSPPTEGQDNRPVPRARTPAGHRTAGHPDTPPASAHPSRAASPAASASLDSPPSSPPLPNSSTAAPTGPFPRLLGWSEHVEDLELYGEGGYHPVHLGDVLNSRYEILHKLGHGGFATVWLAQDLDKQLNVVIKIVRADTFADREINFLSMIKTAALHNIHVAELHDYFEITGPNGEHQCLIMDVCGPSLVHLTWLNQEKRPGLDLMHVASRSLVNSVAALHSQGICHGDLTDFNVLLSLKDIGNWSKAQIYEHLGHPRTMSVVASDGSASTACVPKYLVEATLFPGLTADMFSGTTALIDFGEAFWLETPPASLGTPPSFSAPELSFTFRPTAAADVWALGCLIYEMHTFSPLLPSLFGRRDETLGLAVSIFGALPKTWASRYASNEEGWQYDDDHDDGESSRAAKDLLQESELKHDAAENHEVTTDAISEHAADIAGSDVQADRLEHDDSGAAVESADDLDNISWWFDPTNPLLTTMDAVISERLPSIQIHQQAEFTTLLGKIMKVDASKRISAGEIAADPWFSQALDKKS